MATPRNTGKSRKEKKKKLCRRRGRNRGCRLSTKRSNSRREDKRTKAFSHSSSSTKRQDNLMQIAPKSEFREAFITKSAYFPPKKERYVQFTLLVKTL